MSDVEGFILTGGASSRMGTDKAHLRLDGQQFVERIAGALSSIARRISVVSSRPGADVWGLPVVTDIYGNRGALGGIHAALTHGRTFWAAIVSCDLPFVTGELFERLASFRSARADGDAGESAEAFTAIAPVQEDGRPQPLCALYRRDACLELAESLIRAEELRPRTLLRRARTRWVQPRELADLRDAALFFVNVNTPHDYARACRSAEDRLEEGREF